MGYLEKNPSFNLSYSQGGSDGLDGFADSDWGVSAVETQGVETVRLPDPIYWWPSGFKSSSVSIYLRWRREMMLSSRAEQAAVHHITVR